MSVRHIGRPTTVIVKPMPATVVEGFFGGDEICSLLKISVICVICGSKIMFRQGEKE